ncbi:transcription factor E4F1-like [Leguminivora glycinivorella]|uniref:transcription factor E4F1-like n=1 Tax=Leguminivora glycinivorella TaxID=1035111 RepID=UPI00200F4E77|nr:transcription factor E4F1-like [Leguminivora glycinivorella]
MNFTPFTGHIPTAAAIPTIQHFAAKFGYEGTSTVQERYQGNVQFVTPAVDVKFRQAEMVVPAVDVKFRQAEMVVVSSAPAGSVTLAGIAPIHTVNSGVKYQAISSSTVNLGNVAYGQTYVQEPKEKREYREEDIMATMMQQQETITVTGTPIQQGSQQLLVVLHEPKEAAALARAIKQEARQPVPAEFISIGDVSDATWQSLGGGVADYLSALPLPLHHLLKYSDKREEPVLVQVPSAPVAQQIPSPTVNTVVVQTSPATPPPPPKKKKKKKATKEKKPRPKPGEIRLTTALDGSTLYCCPECHMAYPERGLLEQHLVGHTMERRFICDICNAALKRKDHLTRHKQSHNPERPHVCSVCLKAFKRREQLTLHFVIHSGEKRHVCNECGKGFYRKDHLRKHTRSHIARRVKAELSARGSPPSPAPLPPPAPAPAC